MDNFASNSPRTYFNEDRGRNPIGDASLETGLREENDPFNLDGLMINGDEVFQYADMQQEEITEPFLQPIPDNLLIGDYIEINGVCRGPEIVVSLVVNDSPVDVTVPLSIHMGAGGPIVLKNLVNNREDKVEAYAPVGMQRNLNFELCIYALEDSFEVKLNRNSVGTLKYVVPLENVTQISMGGDAVFTSIEFKDLYGDDESQVLSEDQTGAIKRTEEFRESFSRTNHGPLLIRTSTRRSQRHERLQSPLVVQRPDVDIDPYVSRETMQTVQQSKPQYSPYQNERPLYTDQNSSKSPGGLKFGNRKSVTMEDTTPRGRGLVGGNESEVIPGGAHVGSFHTLDDETPTIYRHGSKFGTSTPDMSEKKKSRSSIFSKNRKSKGSGSDISMDGANGEKKSRGFKSLFKRKSSGVNSKTDVRNSRSLPNVSQNGSETGYHSSTSLREYNTYVGAGADLQPVRGPVPKHMIKQPASSIAAYMAGQKAVPEFDNFQLTTTDGLGYSDEPPVYGSRTSVPGVRGTSYQEPIQGSHKQRDLKGPAPQLADILMESGRSNFEPSVTLTDPRELNLVRDLPSERVSTQPVPNVKAGAPPNRKSHDPAKLKLKGPAAEVAASLENYYQPEPMVDTTITTDRLSSANPSYSPAPSYNVGSQPGVGVVSTHAPVKPGKLKGTAPELAAQLNDRARRMQGPMDETFLSGIDMFKTKQEPVRQEPMKVVRTEKPSIDRDYVTPVENRPVRAFVEPVSAPPQRAYSVDRYEREYDQHSNASSVHSDGGYYLEVGRSPYYHERRRSLKGYQSVKSRRRRSSRTGSIHSSISSLKSGDRVVFARKSGQSRDQVNSWLNGYSDGNQYEGNIKPTQPIRSNVYAEPPVVKLPEVLDLIVPAAKSPIMASPELSRIDDKPQSKFRVYIDMTNELRDDQFGANFAIPLNQGRRARVEGHFLTNHTEEPESCTIRFSTSDKARFLLEIQKDGTLTVYDEEGQLVNTSCENSIPEDRMNFIVDICNSGSHTTITSANDATVIVPGSIDTSELTRLDLVSCSNAELDCFSIANDLAMPIKLISPGMCEPNATQKLVLKTQQSSFTQGIQLEFFTEEKRQFSVVLDYKSDNIFVQEVLEDLSSNVVGRKQMIPFIPEQIKRIQVQRTVGQDEITVQLNDQQVLSHLLTTLKSSDKLTYVSVNGDFVLLDAQFN